MLHSNTRLYHCRKYCNWHRCFLFVLRCQNWMHFTIGHITVLLHWIQTKLPWKPEIVFNYSERIILAYSFVKKRQWVFALFKSTFLRNRSLSNASWFCSEKRKIGKGNLYLTKSQFDRNEICCAEDIHNYRSNMCEKEFWDSKFDK